MNQFAVKTFTDNLGKQHINDLYMLPNGQLAIVSDFDCVIQSITSALQLWLKEYSYNQSDGVPYGIILGNPAIKNALVSFQIKKAILSVNNSMNKEQLSKFGVKKIRNVIYGLNKTTRNFTLSANVVFNNNKAIGFNI
jgi:hypothetical protein